MDVCSVLCRIFKNAQVSIYSLADLNIGHCVSLTFFEGKLGGIFVVKVLKFSYKLKTALIWVESTFTLKTSFM